MAFIDKRDMRILFELDKRGRQTISELAKKTRLSRDVVRYRIKQLEEKKVIRGYIPLIDFTKLGYQIVRLYIKLQNTTKEIEEEIVNYLINQKSVIIAYRTDGNYELAIGLLVKNLIDYQKTYDKLIEKYRPYIVGKDFSVFHDFLQYYKNYLVDEKNRDYEELSTRSFELYDYDYEDLQILRLLSKNARISLLDLAKTLESAPTTVKYRLRKLEKAKVIVAYRALIDYHKLGYEYYKVDLILEDLSIIPGLKEFVRKHPNILYRDLTIGGSDFEFDCELKSQEDFYKLIDEIRTLFPEKIRSFFYYKAINVYKYSYFPRLILEENKDDKN